MQTRVQLIRWAPVVVPALYLLGCIAGGAVVGRAGTGALSQYPSVALVLIIGVAIFCGFGGLCCFWLFADGLEFVRRGYRIRQLPPREYWRWRPGPKAWVYEEWAPEGRIRRLPFVREVLADGYPAPTRVHLPSEDSWDSQAPAWARGHRAAIVERIAECAGHRTQFADLEGPPNPDGLESAKADV
jgi:hypothetical protein